MMTTSTVCAQEGLLAVGKSPRGAQRVPSRSFIKAFVSHRSTWILWLSHSNKRCFTFQIL